MKLILNINQYSYDKFLNSQIDIIEIGLANFCVGYLKSYELASLNEIIRTIHNNNKKIYLSMNIIANESQIKQLESLMPIISKLNIDGFVVSDFGIFQLLKEHNLTNKIIFNPITNITNKYSASISNNLGIDHCCLANELNLKDILEISEYCKGNIEILAQGYYQICNSKRALLTNFFKQYKIKDSSQYYYIKEETRDYSYPIIELNGETLVYIDKQRSIINYLKEIIETNIKYLRIDTMFLSENETLKHIETYNSVLNDLTTIEHKAKELESYSNSNLKCLDNISILKKEKKNG